MLFKGSGNWIYSFFDVLSNIHVRLYHGVYPKLFLLPCLQQIKPNKKNDYVNITLEHFYFPLKNEESKTCKRKELWHICSCQYRHVQIREEKTNRKNKEKGSRSIERGQYCNCHQDKQRTIAEHNVWCRPANEPGQIKQNKTWC